MCVFPVTQPMPFTPASVAGFAHAPGSPQNTAALAPPMAAERMDVSMSSDVGGGAASWARAGEGAPASAGPMSSSRTASERPAAGVRIGCWGRWGRMGTGSGWWEARRDSTSSAA
jgi:hypothetical protein